MEINLSFKPVLLASLIVFLSVEVCDWVLPFRAQGSDLSSVMLYYLIYFIYFMLLGFGLFFRRKRIVINENLIDYNSIVSRLIGVAVFALVLVIYDRIFIQNVDYSQGIVNARESWRAGANNREGVSSFYNVIGNILFPVSFLSFFLIFVFFEEMRRPKRKFYINVFIIIAFSILTGGRELVLILIAFSASSLIFRNFLGRRLLPKRLRRDFFLSVFSMGSFVVYIGYARSFSYAEGLEWYVASIAKRLGGEYISDYPANIAPTVFQPVLVYFAHVKWVLINTIHYDWHEGVSTFRQVFMMLDKYTGFSASGIGYQSPSYSPNWISGVGSLYYDLGFVGLLISAPILPFLWLFVRQLFRVREFNKGCFSFFSVGVYNAMIVMFPFAFLGEIVQFIYVGVSLVLLLTISFGKSFLR